MLIKSDAKVLEEFKNQQKIFKKLCVLFYADKRLLTPKNVMSNSLKMKHSLRAQSILLMYSGIACYPMKTAP